MWYDLENRVCKYNIYCFFYFPLTRAAARPATKTRFVGNYNN